MSEAIIPVLLVAGRPALATRLQALLAAPPLALADRASSATAAVARAGRGDLAAAVLAADTRDLTPAAVATLVTAGLRVVLVADDPAAVPPALTAAGAAIVATATLDAGDALARALMASATTMPSPASAEAAPPAPDASDAPPPTAPPRPAPSPATAARVALPLPRAWARRRAIQTADAPGARATASTDRAAAGAGSSSQRAAGPAGRETTPPAATQALTGRIIGIQGERGGPGASTLARALAPQLAHGDAATLFVDADPAGDSLAGAWALDHPGAGLAALASLAQADEPAWAAALGRELRPVGPRLRALPGLPGPAEAAHVPEVAVTRLLAWAREQAAWVVVDLGRWAGLPWQAAARRACDDLLLVLEPTRAGLLAARGSLAAAGELGTPPPGRALVLGKCGDADEVRPDEAATALGWPVLARLPAAPAWGADLSASSAPADDPYGQALAALAVALGADPGPAAAPARPPRRLWFPMPALRWPIGRSARPSRPRRPTVGGTAPARQAG